MGNGTGCRIVVSLSIGVLYNMSVAGVRVVEFGTYGLRSSEPQRRQSSPRGTPQNWGGLGLGSLFSAENLHYL